MLWAVGRAAISGSARSKGVLNPYNSWYLPSRAARAADYIHSNSDSMFEGTSEMVPHKTPSPANPDYGFKPDF